MGSADPQEVELFSALEWVEEMIERYGGEESRPSWDSFINEVHLGAW